MKKILLRIFLYGLLFLLLTTVGFLGLYFGPQNLDIIDFLNLRYEEKNQSFV